MAVRKKGTTKTTTKTTKRGVVKKKTTGNGVKLKQKTKPSGQQKIKGVATTTKGGKKLTVRNKGVVKSAPKKLSANDFKKAPKMKVMKKAIRKTKKGKPSGAGSYIGSRKISGGRAKKKR